MICPQQGLLDKLELLCLQHPTAARRDQPDPVRYIYRAEAIYRFIAHGQCAFSKIQLLEASCALPHRDGVEQEEGERSQHRRSSSKDCTAG